MKSEGKETMVDIAANLPHASFENDIDAVLARAQAAGVAAIVVTGTSVEGSRAALQLADAHPQLYCTAGVHPHDAANCNAETIPALKALFGHAKVRAVG